MKKLLVLLFLITSISIAQKTTWIKYIDSKAVTAVRIENNFAWVGTLGGLIKLDIKTGDTVSYNVSNSGLPVNNVQTVTIDKSGNKWIGTYLGGLVKFDNTKWTVYNTSNSGLPNNAICSITIDSNDNKWIGTLGGGLAKFDNTKWAVYNILNSGLPNDYVLAIAIDSSNIKWFGTYSGLAKFDDNTWTTYNSNLPTNYILAIVIDKYNNKWIGADGMGLLKFDDTSWTEYNISKPGYPSNFVISLALENNKIWVGSNAGGGLSIFDGGSWTNYNDTNSALPGNYVYSIVIDDNNNKWIGTDKGLSEFNETGIITETEKIDKDLPDNITLSQNYPNPFNPVTNINEQPRRQADGVSKQKKTGFESRRKQRGIYPKRLKFMMSSEEK